MVTQKVQDCRYRVEERALNGAVIASANLPTQEGALAAFAAWRIYLAATAASHGNRSPVEPYGALRLVLIDRETHTLGARSVVDGPAL